MNASADFLCKAMKIMRLEQEKAFIAVSADPASRDSDIVVDSLHAPGVDALR